MRALLLSAYDTISHRLWRERLAALFPDATWCQLCLPARHFEWRLRSNSLEWGLNEYPELDAPWDVLIATSMVDLAALRGLRHALARIPTLLYFHENQFFYPSNPERHSKREANVEPLLIPVFSALCADRVLFNSDFNKQTFLLGARDLFARLPDQLPDSAWNKLDASLIVPVPVAIDAPPDKQESTAENTRSCSTLQVVWNHRWEYDKGPGLLLAVLRQLVACHAPVQVHVIGQQFRQHPPEFTDIAAACAQLSEQQNLPSAQIGYIDSRTEYDELLRRCDVVLSTAWHEFQGLGIQEACLAGATPLAPNDLVYPEYLPEECLYPRCTDSSATADRIVKRLLLWQQRLADGQPLPSASMAHLCGAAIRERYQQVFTELAGARSR